MIISGGVNIYPQEIEDLFSLHPKVADVAVIGVPDEEMGERVVAVVQPAPGVDGRDALAAELRDYARERIAHFKVPTRVPLLRGAAADADRQAGQGPAARPAPRGDVG